MRKILSLILAFALILGAFPTAFANDETNTTEKSYLYTFFHTVHGQNERGTLDADKYSIDDVLEGNDRWGYVGITLPSSEWTLTFTIRSNRMPITLKAPASFSGSTGLDKDSLVAFCFEIEAAPGSYTTRALWTENNTDGKIEFYLIPKEDAPFVTNGAFDSASFKNYILNDIDVSCRIGVGDMANKDGRRNYAGTSQSVSSTNVSNEYGKTMKDVTLRSSSNRYYLIGVITDAGSPADTWSATLNAFSLTPTSETKIALQNSSNSRLISDTALINSQQTVDANNASENSITLNSTTINTYAQDTLGNALGVSSDSAQVGTVYTATAESVKDGCRFLYWARGLGKAKKVVGEDPSGYKFTVEQGEAVHLYAIYAPKDSEKTDVIFYNANGDEISHRAYDKNEEITMPEAQYIAGFGTSIGWTNVETGDTVTSATASGNLMRFVAAYENNSATEPVSVTVIGGSSNKVAYVYGDTVTVTAPSHENGTGTSIFSHWTKDGEVVSFNREYSFKAWEDCSLTAVYGTYTPSETLMRKILVGTNSKGVTVAEFLLGDIVPIEKGMLVSDSANATILSAAGKIAMNGTDNHFSAMASDAAVLTGYAIYEDESGNTKVIYSK